MGRKPIIEGGCGRTPQEIEETAQILSFCVALFVVGVCIALIWSMV